MQGASLEISYHHGRPLAAYYTLPRHGERPKVEQSVEHGHGLIVDHAASGEPLGIEILDPRELTVDTFNALLAELGLPPIDEAELAPLHGG